MAKTATKKTAAATKLPPRTNQTRVTSKLAAKPISKTAMKKAPAKTVTAAVKKTMAKAGARRAK